MNKILAIALVAALGCTPGPPPAKPYVNPCLDCHVTEPEVSPYNWTTYVHDAGVHYQEVNR